MCPCKPLQALYENRRGALCSPGIRGTASARPLPHDRDSKQRNVAVAHDGHNPAHDGHFFFRGQGAGGRASAGVKHVPRIKLPVCRVGSRDKLELEPAYLFDEARDCRRASRHAHEHKAALPATGIKPAARFVDMGVPPWHCGSGPSPKARDHDRCCPSGHRGGTAPPGYVVIP